jgi:hypothetical protein
MAITLTADLRGLAEAFSAFTEIEPEARRLIRSEFADLRLHMLNNADKGDSFFSEVSGNHALCAMAEFLEVASANHPIDITTANKQLPPMADRTALTA